MWLFKSKNSLEKRIQNARIAKLEKQVIELVIFNTQSARQLEDLKNHIIELEYDIDELRGELSNDM
jgi:TolA-binding protein